jgi:hypothetical protein
VGRQRLHHEIVADAEDRGVCADPERERGHPTIVNTGVWISVRAP